jgi:hypothetical protein
MTKKYDIYTPEYISVKCEFCGKYHGKDDNTYLLIKGCVYTKPDEMDFGYIGRENYFKLVDTTDTDPLIVCNDSDCFIKLLKQLDFKNEDYINNDF